MRLDKNGGLHYTRCNLVVSQTWTIGDDDFENCVNESGCCLRQPWTGYHYEHAWMWWLDDDYEGPMEEEPVPAF